MVSTKCLAILRRLSTAPALRRSWSGRAAVCAGVRRQRRWRQGYSRWRSATRRACARAQRPARDCGRRSGARRDSRATVISPRSRSSNRESCSGPLLGQSLDRWRAQRRDPVEPSGLQIRLDARLRDHAAVADQDHPARAEALFELARPARPAWWDRRCCRQTLRPPPGSRRRRTAARRRSAACPACRRGCSRDAPARSSRPSR